eukprot:TRINITY_DN9539_c0_g1_i1.p1 TRINITY_DN9539_c0_g1~~TRINITY_DN9539_c0_g1_i1.p1  ORF type:complete len:113 (+),score=17.94 TRINITY_DN9539_c0_g1_i1:55-393(+)
MERSESDASARDQAAKQANPCTPKPSRILTKRRGSRSSLQDMLLELRVENKEVNLQHCSYVRGDASFKIPLQLLQQKQGEKDKLFFCSFQGGSSSSSPNSQSTSATSSNPWK